ncbi:MAG: putative Fe-S cluster assembly protein SufT [Myxococcales bacterium]|nr:putative Fe-S cluster assembly protein SufT [Myxococcales bacterium]
MSAPPEVRVFGHIQETVILHRDVDAITVPEGAPIELAAGSLAIINQELGGSFTVTVRGNMYRIDGQQADALGREIPVWPEVPPEATRADLEAAVDQTLRTVYDPEIPINIMDLGLVYRCEVLDAEGGVAVEVDMTLTAPACGMGPVLVHDVRSRLRRLHGVVEARVQLVFDPPWSRDMMSEAAQLETGLF